MTAFFTELAAEEQFQEAGSYLADREVPNPRTVPWAEPHAELEPAVYIPVQSPAAFLDALADSWASRDFARELQNMLHELEVTRASQPPVINVTVTPPAGVPAPPPGVYEVHTGEHPAIAVMGVATGRPPHVPGSGSALPPYTPVTRPPEHYTPAKGNVLLASLDDTQDDIPVYRSPRRLLHRLLRRLCRVSAWSRLLPGALRPLKSRSRPAVSREFFTRFAGKRTGPGPAAARDTTTG